MSSDRKAALIGSIGLLLTWALFTVLMVRKVYAGMSGEEFVWLAVLPIPVVLLAVTLQPVGLLLGISLFVRHVAAKILLWIVAIGIQFVVPRWVAQIDFSDDASSSPISLFWTGSTCLWLIAIAIQAFIGTQPTTNMNQE